MGTKNRGTTSDAQREKQAHNQRTKSLMLLQQDLFVMTTTTVFRNLEEERIWDIDQSVKERFNPKSLYELTLREDIPWRQWNQWVREKIVTYLRENGKMLNANKYQQQQQQPMYGQQPQQYGHVQQQGSMLAIWAVTDNSNIHFINSRNNQCMDNNRHS